MCVRMFEEALEIMEQEWDILNMGFKLKESNLRISHVLWVDNLFLLADDLEEYRYMVLGITHLLKTTFDWNWKPSSLEMFFRWVCVQRHVVLEQTTQDRDVTTIK